MSNTGITFNTLKIVGFGNIIDYTVYKLNDPGLTVIRGRNGAGKSTIFSALSWVLYGKPLKSGSTIETWEHKRPSGWAGTMVSVTMYRGETKVKLIRCKDYKRKIGTVKGGNRLIVEEAGVPLDIKDKRDIQKYIEALLGMSHNLFTTSVIFAQKGTRFIELPGPDKKAILEESFKIDWITKAQDLAKSKRKALDKPLALANKEMEGLNKELGSLKEVLDSVEESRKDFEKQKEERIKKIKKDLKDKKAIKGYEGLDTLVKEEEDLKNKRDNAKNALDKFNKENKTLVNDLVTYNIEETQLIASKTKLEKEILVHKQAKVKTCPTCGARLKGSKAKDYLSELEEKLIKEREKLKNVQATLRDLDLLDIRKAKLVKEFDKSQELWEEKSGVLAKAREENVAFEQAKGSIKELEKDLIREKAKEFKDPSKNVKVRVFEIEKQKKGVLKTIKRHSRAISLLTWSITGPLSNNGIKAFLFSKLLQKLNLKLNHYSKFTGVGIELFIDMESSRKNVEAIVYKDEAPVDYHDLSGLMS